MGTVSQDILEKENIPEEHTRDTIIMIGKHLFRKVISPSNNLLSRSKNTYSGVTLPVLDNWVGITLTDLAPVIATIATIWGLAYYINPVRASYPGGLDPQKWKEGHSHNK